MIRSLFPIISVFTFLALVPPAQSQSFFGKEITIKEQADLSKMLKKYHVLQIDAAALVHFVRQFPDQATIHLEWGDAISGDFRLFPKEIRSGDYFLTEVTAEGPVYHPKGENKTFFGYGLNNGKGAVSLTLDTAFIYGFFETGEATWFIEPLWRYIPESQNDLFLVYRSSDVSENENGHCAFNEMKHFVEEEQPLIPSKTSKEKSTGACHVVEIAIASDWLLFDFLGGVDDVENFVLGNLNNVQTNYDDEFNDEIQFELVTQFVSTCSSCDPWNPTTDVFTLLESFRYWGNSGAFGASFDVASLWSNRDFNGSTVGLAWPGTLCATNRYNILQHYTSNAVNLRVLQAHELGHNFSALHDEPNSPTIMAPSVSTSYEWSATSLEVINPYIEYIANEFTCLTDCPAPAPPVAGILAPVTHVCPGSVVPFINNSSSGIDTWSWAFEGNTPNGSTNKNPVILFESEGSFPVTLAVTNGQSFDVVTLDENIQVDENGTKYLLYETFETPPDQWQMINPDNNLPWLWYPTEGLPFGRYSMIIDNYNNNTPGQKDGLVSPPFSLVGETGVLLELDYAYARRNATHLDTLRILASVDGGISFPFLLFEGNENFATSPDNANFFTPAAVADWCLASGCLSVSLDQFSGENDVRIKFENENDAGNNLYIDNVRVRSSCSFTAPAVPGFSTQVAEGCAPFHVAFEDQSSGTIESRIWQFQGGIPGFSTAINPSVLYFTAGVYNVSLTVFNAAGQVTKTEEGYITIHPAPVAGFSFEANGPVVSFYNASLHGTTFDWNFGNGETSTAVHPEISWESPGNYLVSLITSNACGADTVSQEVTIVFPPEASFYASSQQGCAGSTITFNGLPDGQNHFYQWSFPGGSPAVSNQQNPVVTYLQSGQYDVQLIVSNPAGTDTLNTANYITIDDIPAAGFSFSSPPGSGEVTFTDQSSGAENYTWTFGDGQSSTDQNPIHTYDSEGFYPVMLISSNHCGADSTTQELSIIFVPHATFTASETEGCAPAEIQFINQSPGLFNNYQWIFEGGMPQQSTDASPTVFYAQPGTYNVQLIVTNPAGTDTLALGQYISLNTIPQVDFGFQLSGFTADFVNQSQNADTFLWQFGDATTSTEPDPGHTYQQEGNFIITLTGSNHCGEAFFQDTLEIISILPGIDFSVDHETGCPPLTIQFENHSTAADSLYWTFTGGTPEFSDEQNPVVVYETSGSYEVSLTGFNVFGSSTQTLSTAITVDPLPLAAFDFELNGVEVHFINLSVYHTENTWHFGDDSLSHEENPIHLFENSGLYEVVLVVENECGSDTVSQQVNIILDGINSPAVSAEFVIFPNPASTSIIVEIFPASQRNLPCIFSLFDALGRKIQTFTLVAPVTELSLTEMPEGIYFYELSQEGVFWGKGKLVLLR